MYRGKQKTSPIKAVHEFCIECMNGDLREVRTCRVDGYHVKDKCPVFDFRTGHTERGNYPDVPVLSAIRQYCLNCVGTYDETRECTCDGSGACNGLDNYKCPLYEFRFGTNPFSKKKGRSPEELEEIRSRSKILADLFP